MELQKFFRYNQIVRQVKLTDFLIKELSTAIIP